MPLILCALILYFVFGILFRVTVKGISERETVTGRWIGKRVKTAFDLPQEKEVIELYLPDGSSAQMTLVKDRNLSRIYNSDGAINGAFISRENPELFEPLSVRKGDFILMSLSFFSLIVGNYAIADMLYKDSLPQLYYILEVIFIVAVLLRFNVKKMWRQSSDWEAYKDVLAERENKFDTTYGLVNKRATFNLCRAQDDIDRLKEIKAPLTRSKFLVIVPLVLALFILLEWQDIRLLYYPHATAVAEVTYTKIKHESRAGNMCDITIQFQHVGFSHTFTRTAHTTVNPYSPYCQFGEKIDVAYDPNNEQKLPIFFYTSSLLAWDIGKEILLILAFIYSTIFCLKTKAK